MDRRSEYALRAQQLRQQKRLAAAERLRLAEIENEGSRTNLLRRFEKEPTKNLGHPSGMADAMTDVGLRVDLFDDRSWAIPSEVGFRGARNSSRDELRHERVDEGSSDRSGGGSSDRSDEPKAKVPS